MAQEITDKEQKVKNKGRPMSEKELKEYNQTWIDLDALSDFIHRAKTCKNK